MGYGQGPGQAANIGGLFEENGFVGGKSFGLSIAAFGILWACTAGIYYINKRSKEGKIQRADEEIAQVVSAEEIESIDEIPVSEAIDKMSIQIILISVTYALSFLFMKTVTTLINIKEVTGLIWGFNFIFGMLFAMFVKVILKGLRKSKLMKRKYTNEYMLNRITGVVFDYMIVAGMSINIEVLANTGLWVGLLVITTVEAFNGTLRYGQRIYPDYEHQAFVLFGNLAGPLRMASLCAKIDPDFKTPAADDLVTGSSTPFCLVRRVAITALIYQPKWYYLWGSWVVMIIFFVLFSFLLFKKPAKTKKAKKQTD